MKIETSGLKSVEILEMSKTVEIELMENLAWRRAIIVMDTGSYEKLEAAVIERWLKKKGDISCQGLK